MPPTPPAVHCVLCGRCTLQNSHVDGMLANFLTQLSRLLCAVQPMHDKKQPFTETELSPFFSRDLSSSLGTVRPFCYEKMRSAWTELSPIFFWDHFWIAFAVPPHTEITWRIAMISYPKGFNLRQFWDHFGVQNGLVDPFPAPGTNLEARRLSRPRFHHFSTPCFGTLFGQVLVLEWKYVEHPSKNPVFVPSLIFERFSIEFEVTFGGQKWSQV